MNACTRTDAHSIGECPNYPDPDIEEIEDIGVPAPLRPGEYLGEGDNRGEFGDCPGCGAGGSTPHWIHCRFAR